MADAQRAAFESVNRSPAGARVLVATGNVPDAEQIVALLEDDFGTLQSSTDPRRDVADFEIFLPDVIVLAQERLELARTYYLGLYRTSLLMTHHPHRTVVLCNKEEVRAAFELCKNGVFDDYVLFWPHSFDGPRLAMTIWNARRGMIASRRDGPDRDDLRAHARRLEDLEQGVDQATAEARQRLQFARVALQDAELGIAENLDSFSRHLGEREQQRVSVDPPEAFDACIAALKDQQIRHRRCGGMAVTQAADVLATDFGQTVGPILAETRTLREKIQGARALVMIVDDDALVRTLIENALDPAIYDAVFAEDAAAAMNHLQKLRPDVILMDVRMPGLDGVGLTLRLKAVPSLARIPVVMMTGDARRQTLLDSMRAGATSFMVKPFTREGLLEKLQKALAGVPAAGV